MHIKCITKLKKEQPNFDVDIANFFLLQMEYSCLFKCVFQFILVMVNIAHI